MNITPPRYDRAHLLHLLGLARAELRDPRPVLNNAAHTARHTLLCLIDGALNTPDQATEPARAAVPSVPDMPALLRLPNGCHIAPTHVVSIKPHNTWEAYPGGPTFLPSVNIHHGDSSVAIWFDTYEAAVSYADALAAVVNKARATGAPSSEPCS